MKRPLYTCHTKENSGVSFTTAEYLYIGKLDWNEKQLYVYLKYIKNSQEICV